MGIEAGMAIEVLAQDVVNQIAAGEVLERPSNLVKELVENSIDAGSSQIEIDIDDGGRYLKITDNGCGISKEDLPKAILRHATSKISKFHDLWSLASYGFRGEALASVAAVSELTIKSKLSTESSSYVLKTSYGVSNNVFDQSGENGTTITVEKLFENVPARLKFLKTEAAEASQIFKVIKAFALCHPHIEFKVRNKNILKYFYPKTKSLIERVQTVLEQETLYETHQTHGNQSIQVLFSSPKDVNRTAQNIWIFVQKRWIQDRALQKAIMDAYQNLLMHGEYPSCVLFLDCDPQTIDVNIHPTKSQVKFQDPSQAFRSVYHTLRDALEKGPWLKSLFDLPQEEQSANQVPFLPSDISSTSSIQNAVESFAKNYQMQDSFQESHFQMAQFKTKEIVPYAKPSTLVQKISEQRVENNSTPTIQNVNLEPLWGSLQVLGQLNQTYILAQSRQSLFLIDQHASHERVMFEKLNSSWREQKFEIQSYLLPLSLDLSPEKIEALIKNKDEFTRIGIELEQSSPESISIYSAPSFIKEFAIVEALIKMSQDLLDLGGAFQIQKKITDIFATMACHSAIRAGQALSSEEMKELLVSMDAFPLSSFCPHGRPVFKQITFLELDRDFGRIV